MKPVLKYFLFCFLAAALTQSVYAGPFDQVTFKDETPATGPKIVVVKQGKEHQPLLLLATYNGKEVKVFIEYNVNSITVTATQNGRNVPVTRETVLQTVRGTITPFSDKNMKLEYYGFTKTGECLVSAKYTKQNIEKAYLGIGKILSTTKFEAEYYDNDQKRNVAKSVTDASGYTYDRIDYREKDGKRVSTLSERSTPGQVIKTKDYYSKSGDAVEERQIATVDNYGSSEGEEKYSLRILTSESPAEKDMFKAEWKEGDEQYKVWFNEDDIGYRDIPSNQVGRIIGLPAALYACEESIKDARLYQAAMNGANIPTYEAPSEGVKLANILPGPIEIMPKGERTFTATYNGATTTITITHEGGYAAINTDNNGYTKSTVVSNIEKWQTTEVSPFKDFPEIKVQLHFLVDNETVYTHENSSTYTGRTDVIKDKNNSIIGFTQTITYYDSDSAKEFGTSIINRYIAGNVKTETITTKNNRMYGKKENVTVMKEYRTGDIKTETNKTYYNYLTDGKEYKNTVTRDFVLTPYSNDVKGEIIDTEYGPADGEVLISTRKIISARDQELTLDKKTAGNKRIVLVKDGGYQTNANIVKSFTISNLTANGQEEEIFKAVSQGKSSHKYTLWYKGEYQKTTSMNLSTKIYSASFIDIKKAQEIFSKSIEAAEKYAPTGDPNLLQITDDTHKGNIDYFAEKANAEKKAADKLKKGVEELQKTTGADYAKAAKLIRDAINSHHISSKKEAYYYLGCAELAQGNYQEALDAFKESYFDGSSNETGWVINVNFRKGMAQLGLKEYQEAIASFEVVTNWVDLKHSDRVKMSIGASAYYLSGYAYAVLGNYNEANKQQALAVEMAKASGFPLQKYIDGTGTMDYIYKLANEGGAKALSENKVAIAELLYGGLLEEMLKDANYDAQGIDIAYDLTITFNTANEAAAMTKLEEVVADTKIQTEFSVDDITTAQYKLKASGAMENLKGRTMLEFFLEGLSANERKIYFEALLKDTEEGTPDERAIKFTRLLALSVALYNPKSPSTKSRPATEFDLDVLRFGALTFLRAQAFADKYGKETGFDIDKARNDADWFIDRIKAEERSKRK